MWESSFLFKLCGGLVASLVFRILTAPHRLIIPDAHRGSQCKFFSLRTFFLHWNDGNVRINSHPQTAFLVTLSPSNYVADIVKKKRKNTTRPDTCERWDIWSVSWKFITYKSTSQNPKTETIYRKDHQTRHFFRVICSDSFRWIFLHCTVFTCNVVLKRNWKNCQKTRFCVQNSTWVNLNDKNINRSP